MNHLAKVLPCIALIVIALSQTVSAQEDFRVEEAFCNIPLDALSGKYLYVAVTANDGLKCWPGRVLKVDPALPRSALLVFRLSVKYSKKPTKNEETIVAGFSIHTAPPVGYWGTPDPIDPKDIGKYLSGSRRIAGSLGPSWFKAGQSVHHNPKTRTFPGDGLEMRDPNHFYKLWLPFIDSDANLGLSIFSAESLADLETDKRIVFVSPYDKPKWRKFSEPDKQSDQYIRFESIR